MTLISQLLGVPPEPEEGPAFIAGDENDRWNAAKLAAAEGWRMIYVGGKGWGIWDGGRFNFADGGLRAREIADRLQDLIAAEAEAAWRADHPELDIERRLSLPGVKGRPAVDTRAQALAALQREAWIALRNHAITCGNLQTMTRALTILEYRQRVALASLDADPWSFTLPNGRLDLRAAAYAEITPDMTRAQVAEVRAQWLKPHERSLYPTKCAGVEFDPGAECPEWRAFLELILPDPEVRDCFHRSMGVLLFGKNEPICMFLFRGSGGNGKSTAVNAIAHVLGDEAGSGYAVPCRVEMFLATQNESAGKATPEEVDFPGARMLIASEPSPTDELSAKKIKALTGNDPRPARGLNCPQFYYRPSAFPILSFNRTPRIKDEDEGTRRRLVFFPFDVNLSKLPEDKRRSPVEITDALKAEGPGILNWLLEGWREYRRRADLGLGRPVGIDPPAKMIDLKDTLMEHADPIGEFIKDCCEMEPGAVGIRTSQFFRVYSLWCDMTGSPSYGKQAVSRIMQEKGITRRKAGGGIMHWGGVKWTASDNMTALLSRCYVAGEDDPAPSASASPRDYGIDPGEPF